MKKHLQRLLLIAAMILVPWVTQAQTPTDPISTFPYTCDFEGSGDSASWVTVNGTQENGWYVGNAANATTGGSYSLYVSNNSGTSNAYNVTSASASYTWAYRRFTFTPGSYNISFQWKCVGESDGDPYDFFRVFIVPDNVVLTAGQLPSSTYTWSNQFMSDVPSGWIGINGTNTYFCDQSSYTTLNSNFAITTAGNYKLVFLWLNDDNVFNNPPASIDDISISANTCAPSVGLEFVSATETSITYSWTNLNGASQWVVEYDTVDFVPGTGAGTIHLCSDTSLTITDSLTALDSGMAYYIYVYANCGGGDTSTSSFLLARTVNNELPYMCDFEGANADEWDLINGTQTNKWYIGTATHNSGTHSLYISDNNGVANNYSGSESYVFAVKEFELAAGEYAYSYDWKCQAESSFDFIRAAMVPENTVITAGSYCGFDNTSSMPAGGIALDGGYRLNLQSSWQTQQGTFTIVTPGTYKWVFLWRNDGSVYNQPPAAIDNIYLQQNTCPAPVLYVDRTSPDSIVVNWHPVGEETSWIISNGTTEDIVFDTTYAYGNLQSNTEYHFTVRAICAPDDTSMPVSIYQRTPCVYMDSLPFFYDFEDAPVGTSNTGSAFPFCWTRLNNGSSYGGYPYVNSSSTYNHTPSGNKGLYWYLTTTTGTYGDYEVVVLPGVDTNVYPARNLQLRFWAKSSSTSYYPVFQVGVMTNPDDNNTFYPVDTIEVGNSTNWREFDVPLGIYPGNGSFVAIRAVRPASSWYAYVDDITLEVAPSCPRIPDLEVHPTAASAYLSWNYSTTLGITPYNFEISIHETADTSIAPNTTIATSLSEVLTGLDPSTSYTVSVAAVCDDDDHGTPATVVFTTHAITSYCSAPYVMLDSITSTDAYISWVAGYEETLWDVDYRLMGAPAWTSAEMATGSNNATISGLSPNTRYEVRVGALCSDTTLYTVLNILTGCGSMPVPFREGFDGSDWSTSTADPLPQCWFKKTNYSTSYPYASTSYNHTPSGSKAMYMYSTNTTWSYMVLPKFAPSLDSLQVSFWLYKTNTTYPHRLEVGVITDPNEPSTFEVIDTVAPSALSTWEEFTVLMHSDSNGGGYIAIRSFNNEYCYPYLDDILVDYVPDCMPVIGLTASNPTTNSIDLQWIDTTGSTSWIVEYGPGGFAVGTGTSITVFDTAVTLTGLSSNTSYDVYVTPDCSDGVAGSAFATFRTECGYITVLPYFENFEGFAEGTSNIAPPNCGIPCYHRLDNSTQYHFGYIGSRSSWPTGGHSGSGFIYYYMPTTTGTYADWIITVLPPIDQDLFPINTLQVSFWVKMNSSSTQGDIVVGVMSDPTVDSTFVPVDTVHVAGADYDMKLAYLSNYEDTGCYIALRYTRDPSTTTYYFVDDITVEPIPACPPVSDIVLAGIDSTLLSVTWTENGDATSWEVEYGPTGFILGTGTTVTVTSVPLTITGLTPATEYDVYVTPTCPSGTSATRMATFRTANAYVQLPFNCNFENGTQNQLWALENGTNTNKWYIGSATNNGGNYSLYISDNSGTANSYTISSSTLDFAYVDVMIPTPGDYGYSYDWKCYGESTLDYLRVALIPASESLTAGTSLPSGLSATSMPSTWISLDGSNKLNLNGSWQTRADVITVPSAGVYHLAFIFRCDGSVGTMPPPAVDNIVLVHSPCTRPDSITITNLSQTSADFTWSEPASSTEWQYQLDNGTTTTVYSTNTSLTGLTANTAYTFKVRSICGGGDTSFWRVYSFRTPCNYITMPYTQDFELEATSSSTTGSAFVNCWIRLNNGTSYGGYPYVSSSSTYNHTTGGSKGLYWYNTTTTGTYGDYEAVVLPGVDTSISINNLQLTFWAKASSASYSPQMQIGVMTDPNNIESFVGVDTITFSGTDWSEIEVSLSNYTGTGRFVAVKNDRATWTAYFDDFYLDYIPTCVSPRNIFTTDVTTHSLTVDWVDITPAMEWQVEYGPQGYTRGSAAGTALSVTSHPVTLTGLDTLTNYDVYIRSICTVGDTSRWRQPSTFTTAMCGNSDVFAIGSASSSGSSYYAPVCNYYNYTLSESIIDSAEFGGPMDIEYIGYYYTYSSPSTDKTNCTIYFQPTTLSSFSSTSSIVALDSTATMVYTGHLNCSQGWNYFTLSTPYHYDGSGNLLIIVDDNSGAYDGSSYTFKTESCSGSKTIYYYSDSNNPDPLNPTSLSVNMGTASWRPVMQLVSCAADACSQPTITSVTKDYQSATITWMGDGTEYQVNIKETTAAWPDSNINVTGTTYTFSGLNPATSYTFRVRQDCNADSNGYSEWVEDFVVTDSLPCFPPHSLHVTNVTNATATFDWITIGNENTWEIHVWTPGDIDSIYRVTSHPVTVGGFTAGLTYNAEVRALCGVNLLEGDWSATMTFATAICPNVANVSAGNVTDNSALITWDLDTMAQSWIVEYGYAGFDQGSGTIVPCTANSFNATGLECETSYDFYVRAVCGTDWTSENWSRVSFTTDYCAEPCDAPFGVTATVNLNNVDVSWTPGEGNTAFEVEYGSRGFSHGSGTTVGATEPHATLTGLDYNTQYDLYVRALCGADNYSAWTPVTTFTTGTQGIANADGVSCTISPNPATSSTTISVGGVNGKVKIEVVDMNGRTVASEALECNSDCVKTMEVDKLAQGAYFVRINGEQVNMVRKLIVK